MNAICRGLRRQYWFTLGFCRMGRNFRAKKISRILRFFAKITKLNYFFWSPKMSNCENLLPRKFSNCRITKTNSSKIFHKLMNREIWSFCLIQCILICVFSRPSIIFVICAKKYSFLLTCLKDFHVGMCRYSRLAVHSSQRPLFSIKFSAVRISWISLMKAPAECKKFQRKTVGVEINAQQGENIYWDHSQNHKVRL